jgi:hypothetical protein
MFVNITPRKEAHILCLEVGVDLLTPTSRHKIHPNLNDYTYNLCLIIYVKFRCCHVICMFRFMITFASCLKIEWIPWVRDIIKLGIKLDYWHSSFWPPYFGKCLHLKGNGLNTSSNIVRVLEKGLQWLMWLCCKGLKIESKTQSWKKWFQTIINKLPSDKKLDPISIWWWVQISIKA